MTGQKVPAGHDLEEPLLGPSVADVTPPALAALPVDQYVAANAPPTASKTPTQCAHAAASSTRRCHWLQTTATLLTLQLGWGLWLMPSDFARLGWIPGAGALVTLALLTMYSGFLFSRLYQFVPGAVLFGDVGEHISGPAGRAWVYTIIYSLDATRCVILHLAASQSLQHIFPEDQHPPLWQCGLGVLVLAFVLVQVRALSQLSWFFMIGTLSQLVAIGIVVLDLVQRPDPHAEHFLVVPLTPATLTAAAVALLNMIFAFGGQFAFIEIMTAMRTPSFFPRAVSLCTVVMASLYGCLGVVGYWSKGTNVSEIIIFSLQPGPLARIAAACILVQAIAQYLVNLNVWTHNLLTLLARHFRWASDIECSSDHCPKQWLVATAFVLAYSYGISTVIPFFSTLVGLVTSVTYLTCAYTLPAWFTLKAMGPKLNFFERLLLRTLIPLTVMLSGVGLACSVAALLEDLKHGGSGHGGVGVAQAQAEAVYAAAAGALRMP